MPQVFVVRVRGNDLACYQAVLAEPVYRLVMPAFKIQATIFDEAAVDVRCRERLEIVDDGLATLLAARRRGEAGYQYL